MKLAFLQDFAPIGILLLGAAGCAALDLRAFDSRGRRGHATRWLTLATLILAFGASIGFWHSSFGSTPPDIEHGSLVIDRFALYFYAITLAAAGAVVLCGADAEAEMDPHRGVFHLLLLMSCAGVLFTASAGDLVELGSGLALTVLPMALAQGLHKTDAAAVRTAARALSVSGFTLAMFFLGAAILAGLAGTTSLHALPAGLRQVDPLLVLGAILLVLGALAQLGVFPYLWWRGGLSGRLPSLPFLAATLLGALAGTAALLRLLPGALGATPASWTLAVTVLAGVTLVVAPYVAWRQRRLGPAVIFLLVGQLALVPATLPEISQQGTAAILYLLLCVIPLAAGLLGLLGAITVQGERAGTAELRGLWARSPVLAGGLALLLASLAGLPPLAGFFARLLTVDAALHAGLGWLVWLELLSAVLSALVVFRWLLTIFDTRVDGPDLALPERAAMIGIVLCTGAVLSFGLLVGPLFAIALRGALPPLIGP
ncbi:MAG: proton-conducting transporter membrane subunit [Candidatus Dormibacteria bacterium]